MSEPETVIVTLYGRNGCHLCLEAGLLLGRLAAECGFTLREIDVDTDAVLLQQYDSAVPVIASGARELARAPIDPVALRRALKALCDGG